MLYDLVKAGRKWQWSTQHDGCLEQLKEDMSREVVLAYPDLDKDFYIIDGSTVGTASILYQHSGNTKKIVEFAGKILRPCEARYTITKGSGHCLA